MGWLVDTEKILGPPRSVVFFEDDGKKYVAIGSVVSQLTGAEQIRHHRGVLFSTFELTNGQDSIAKITYVTPWWRIIFDDGSHTETNFPLKFLAEKWLQPVLFFSAEYRARLVVAESITGAD